MNKEREKEHEFLGQVATFYNKLEMGNEYQLPEIIQCVKVLVHENGFRILEIPLEDKEISAFYYNGDKSRRYIILNSSLQKINNNFALLHESYHILFRKQKYAQEAESYVLSYDLDDEEACANTFAGVILMPKDPFIRIFNKVREIYAKHFGSKKSMLPEFLTIVYLMSYFKTTYMSVLIRCAELDLIGLEDAVIDELLNSGTNDTILKACKIMMLDESFLDKSGRDDFVVFEENAKEDLDNAVREGIAKQEDVEFLLEKLRSYHKILIG